MEIIPLTRRQKILHEYESLSSSEKRSFIINFCEHLETKRLRSEGEITSRRTQSIAYHLRDETGKRVNVCKSFFLTTLGKDPRNDKMIHYSMAKNPDNVFISEAHRLTGRRGNYRKSSLEVDDHIKSYDPSISHYRRPHAPHVLYLNSELTISCMYLDYIEKKKKKKKIYFRFSGKKKKKKKITF